MSVSRRELRAAHKKKRSGDTINASYAVLLLLAVVSLALLGPLRGFTVSVGAPVTVPATFLLFMTPGVVLAGLLGGASRGDLDVPTMAPLAFAFSVGLFGILAVPALVLQGPTKYYLLACGIVVALSLLGTLFLALQDRGAPVEPAEASGGPRAWLLWLPLAALVAVMAAASANAVQRPDADFWAYLMYVRDFMGSDQLNAGSQGFSRTTFSGWLLEQAALARISGVDPVALLARYLGPVLVVVAILALYGLARVLFEDGRLALFTASLASIFFLSHMAYADSGNELLIRITEDKFLARFILLPVTLGLALLFLRTRRPVYLGAFAFLCWSVITVHYIGFVLLGISLTGFGLIHLVFNLRNRWSWTAFLALGGTMLVAGLPALVYVLKNGISFLAQLDSGSPESVAVQVFLARYSEHLTVLGENTYIMHPALILDPPVLIALVAGIPFLAYHARRSVTAQMLLGMLLFTAFLVYFPPAAMLVGEVIGPWTLWRVAWPIELAALLTLGWLAWWILQLLGGYLESVNRGRLLTPFLPLILIGILLAMFLGPMTKGVRSVSATGETPLNASTCEDPLFVWMQDVVTENTVVFSEEEEQRCIQAHVAPAWLFSYRSSTFTTGQALLKGDSGEKTDLPQVVVDEQKFFEARVFDEEMIQVLKRYGVGYVVLPQDSPLNGQLRHLPGFEELDNPGSRYRSYSVAVDDLRRTPAVAMNDSLTGGDPERALASYPEVLGGNEDEQFLAHLGAGLAYTELGEPGRAAESYERALSLFPDSPTVYPSLVEAYQEAEDYGAARTTLMRAVKRYPANVDLRLELASMQTNWGVGDKALEHYRTVVEDHPDVPDYRARLGGGLLEVGRSEAAEAEFERAIRLNPLSTAVYLQVGQANAAAGRPKEAAEVYERAVRMDLDNQLVRFRLGQLYATLVEQGENEYFGRAEEHLTKAGEMLPYSPSSDQSAAAYLALGDLYRRAERPEDARESYEKALEADPDFEPAQNRLE